MKAGPVDDAVGEFYGNQHTGSTCDNYSYENLVEDVSELASELGHPPTTAEAAEDERLPSIATMYDIIGEDWANVLVDAGLEPGALQYSEYGPSARNEMLMDLRRCCKRTTGETLTTRAYEGVGAYSKDTIKKYFGTWSAACERAGISPGTRHGDDSEGPNGNRLDSRHELAIAEWLDEHGVEYNTHRPLGVTRYTCDFYLPRFELWVEVDGYVRGGRPNAEGFARKLGYYAFRQLDYVVVETPTELASALDSRSESNTSRQTKGGPADTR